MLLLRGDFQLRKCKLFWSRVTMELTHDRFGLALHLKPTSPSVFHRHEYKVYFDLTASVTFTSKVHRLTRERVFDIVITYGTRGKTMHLRSLTAAQHETWRRAIDSALEKTKVLTRSAVVSPGTASNATTLSRSTSEDTVTTTPRIATEPVAPAPRPAAPSARSSQLRTCVNQAAECGGIGHTTKHLRGMLRSRARLLAAAVRPASSSINIPMPSWTNKHADELRQRLNTCAAASLTRTLDVHDIAFSLDAIQSWTPNNGNCQFYSIIECLRQQAIEDMDDPNTAEYLTQTLKTGLRHAALLHFNRDYADGSLHHMLDFHDDGNDFPSVAHQQRIIREYFTNVAASSSSLDNFIGPKVWGGHETLRQACKLLGRRIYCIVEPEDTVDCSFLMYASTSPEDDKFQCSSIESGEPMAVHDWLTSMATDPTLALMPPIVIHLRRAHYSSMLFVDAMAET